MWQLIRHSIRWPATGIFWQIFFWFWITMVAVIFAAIMAVLWSMSPSDFVPERRALYHELELSGQLLTNQLRQHPQEPWPQALKQALRNNNSRLYLLDELGRTPERLKVPKEVLAFHSENYESAIFQVTVAGNTVVVGPYQLEVGGNDYQLYLTKERPQLAWLRILALISKHISLVIAAIGVSILLCLLLSARLVWPVQELQRVSRRLAGGDLSARVKPRVSRRFDELGELGQDFDRMADQLNELIESKERLLRDVSHELRSPLTRLQLALALARKKVGDQAEREHTRIEREIERLNTVIGNIIAWSRLATAPNKERLAIALKPLLQKLVLDTDYEAKARQVRVKLLSCGDETLLGNTEMLRSAVENIIRNAIRFAPPESVIEVSQSTEAKGDDLFAVIQIRDYGPGVPEESVAKLFEPFYRVDATRGQENSGSGLGMAIARRMVDHHHGSIRAENAKPGLRVIIELPLPA